MNVRCRPHFHTVWRLSTADMSNSYLNDTVVFIKKNYIAWSLVTYIGNGDKLYDINEETERVNFQMTLVLDMRVFFKIRFNKLPVTILELIFFCILSLMTFKCFKFQPKWIIYMYCSCIK